MNSSWAGRLSAIPRRTEVAAEQGPVPAHLLGPVQGSENLSGRRARPAPRRATGAPARADTRTATSAPQEDAEDARGGAIPRSPEPVTEEARAAARRDRARKAGLASVAARRARGLRVGAPRKAGTEEALALMADLILADPRLSVKAAAREVAGGQLAMTTLAQHFRNARAALLAAAAQRNGAAYHRPPPAPPWRRIERTSPAGKRGRGPVKNAPAEVRIYNSVSRALYLTRAAADLAPFAAGEEVLILYHPGEGRVLLRRTGRGERGWVVCDGTHGSLVISIGNALLKLGAAPGSYRATREERDGEECLGFTIKPMEEEPLYDGSEN